MQPTPGNNLPEFNRLSFSQDTGGGSGSSPTLELAIRALEDVPTEWNNGKVDLYRTDAPVNFREIPAGETYEYYGNKGESDTHLISQRFKGFDANGNPEWKDASPIIRDHFEAMYEPNPDVEGAYIKVEPTKVIPIPTGVTVKLTVESDGGNVETLTSNDAIAIDVRGNLYRFPLAKNTSGDSPAYYFAGQQGRESLFS